MATMQVEIVSAERSLLSVEATEVIARSLEGEFGILPGHMPMLAALQIAPIVIKLADGGEERVACHHGFLFFQDNKLVVLADLAELASDIDVARARAKADERKAQIDGASSEDDDARASLRKAEVRVAVGG